MSALVIAGVGVAGALGACARHLLDEAVRARRPDSLLGIFVVNLIGSAALGALTGAVLFHGWSSDWVRIGGSGFCGGFTTLSTVAVATVLAARQGQPRRAAANALGTLAATLLAAALGLLAISL